MNTPEKCSVPGGPLVTPRKSDPIWFRGMASRSRPKPNLPLCQCRTREELGAQTFVLLWLRFKEETLGGPCRCKTGQITAQPKTSKHSNRDGSETDEQLEEIPAVSGRLLAHVNTNKVELNYAALGLKSPGRGNSSPNYTQNTTA